MSTDVNYSKEFIQSILAYFSYVNMDGSSDGNIKWDDLKDVDLSNTLGNIRFMENFNKYLNKKYEANYALNEFKSIEFVIKFFTDNFVIKKSISNQRF